MTNEKSVFSRSEIDDAWERNFHKGSLVWAHKLEKPQPGCFLMNHWQQQVVALTDYDPNLGAQGFNLDVKTSNGKIVWPKLALEMEILERKWQPIRVSDEIFTGKIFNYLPTKMPNAKWEFLFLLLLSSENDGEVLQGLLDTGLSPRQGLFAYLRLLRKVLARVESVDGVPEYRKIFESELSF